MRVLQLIDSLEAGGAERMAVSLANAFASEVEYSGICTTRGEGVLKVQLNDSVDYYFLQKKSTFDFAALLRLKKIIKKEQIQIVHAHTTSYFLGTLLKIICPKVKLIWHTHLGSRVSTSAKENRALVKCSRFFSSIITVNEELKTWCETNLSTKEVHYLPNFVDTRLFKNNESERQNKIVCLANLKDPKNHLNLLDAFKQVLSVHPDWELKLAGAMYGDVYENDVRRFIEEHNLDQKADLMGVVEDIPALLSNAKIGVLSSDSEGLPMSLLEYGAAGLAVVTTKTGQCEIVINGHGTSVPIKEPNALAQAILSYIDQSDKLKEDANAFRSHIKANYSVDAVIPQLLNTYKI